MNTTLRQPDVLIIGAGPAGSCAASMLARAGHSVTVVEKSVFPRFAIGESLLPQCMELLEEAGLLETVKAQGYQLKQGAVFRRGEESCQIRFAEQFHPGYDYTFQVPRADFDHTLALQAGAYGAEYLFGHGCRSVDFSGDRPRVEVEDPEGGRHLFQPRFVLDASGFGHVLPRLLKLGQPTGLALRSSCFAHVEGDPGDPDYGKEFIIISINADHHDVWYWTIPFSHDRTSFGIVAEMDYINRLPSSPEERIRAAFASDPVTHERLAGSRILTEPGLLSGYAHSVSRLHGEHFAILGHSGEFLDPVFSSGVTIALKSSVLASKLLLRQFAGETVDWEADYRGELMHGVNVFKTYVKAWYNGTFQPILFSPDKDDHLASLVCSILAGYVWDRDNTLAMQHERGLSLLSEICLS